MVIPKTKHSRLRVGRVVALAVVLLIILATAVLLVIYGNPFAGWGRAEQSTDPAYFLPSELPTPPIATTPAPEPDSMPTPESAPTAEPEPEPTPIPEPTESAEQAEPTESINQDYHDGFLHGMARGWNHAVRTVSIRDRSQELELGIDVYIQFALSEPDAFTAFRDDVLPTQPHQSIRFLDSDFYTGYLEGFVMGRNIALENIFNRRVEFLLENFGVLFEFEIALLSYDELVHSAYEDLELWPNSEIFNHFSYTVVDEAGFSQQPRIETDSRPQIGTGQPQMFIDGRYRPVITNIHGHAVYYIDDDGNLVSLWE